MSQFSNEENEHTAHFFREIGNIEGGGVLSLLLYELKKKIKKIKINTPIFVF